VNYHTTYSYGGGSEFSLPLEKADLLLGVDTGRDQIRSTNMGKHARQYGGFSLGLAGDPQERLAIDARARFQGYEDWGFQESFNLALGYYLVDDRLRAKASAGRSFRIPSFTELYYSDPANQGNPELDIEESDNFRMGLSIEANMISVGLEGFLRRGRNLIDWTRVIATDPWQATNLGQVDYFGGELTCKIGRQVSFSYVYTDANKKAEGFFSKYALDILQHQCILGLDFVVGGLKLNGQLSYNQRRFGETYFVGNFCLSKQMKAGDFVFEPFVKIDNFSDTTYSEVGGVLQPGRWVQGGVRLEW
jgi:vitamin B12 transporter